MRRDAGMPPFGRLVAVVVSGEFRRARFPGEDAGTVLDRYRHHSAGLVVFTSGAGAVRYARSGTPGGEVQPFSVPVVSTLGAGDVFRAGIAWGLIQKWDDTRTVRFAAALAALVCTKMPIADTVPALGEVEAFLRAADESASNSAVRRITH